jgi:hypothetical protein
MYRFACPVQGEVHVLLSAFRSIAQLPGTAHPALFRVRFGCDCGEQHDGLLTHTSLDLMPLGLGTGELEAVTADRIKRGAWPWSFFATRRSSRVPCSRPRSRC